MFRTIFQFLELIETQTSPSTYLSGSVSNTWYDLIKRWMPKSSTILSTESWIIPGGILRSLGLLTAFGRASTLRRRSCDVFVFLGFVWFSLFYLGNFLEGHCYHHRHLCNCLDFFPFAFIGPACYIICSICSDFYWRTAPSIGTAFSWVGLINPQNLANYESELGYFP